MRARHWFGLCLMVLASWGWARVFSIEETVETSRLAEVDSSLKRSCDVTSALLDAMGTQLLERARRMAEPGVRAAPGAQQEQVDELARDGEGESWAWIASDGSLLARSLNPRMKGISWQHLAPVATALEGGAMVSLMVVEGQWSLLAAAPVRPAGEGVVAVTRRLAGRAVLEVAQGVGAELVLRAGADEIASTLPIGDAEVFARLQGVGELPALDESRTVSLAARSWRVMSVPLGPVHGYLLRPTRLVGGSEQAPLPADSTLPWLVALALTLAALLGWRRWKEPGVTLPLVDDYRRASSPALGTSPLKGHAEGLQVPDSFADEPSWTAWAMRAQLQEEIADQPSRPRPISVVLDEAPSLRRLGSWPPVRASFLNHLLPGRKRRRPQGSGLHVEAVGEPAVDDIGLGDEAVPVADAATGPERVARWQRLFVAFKASKVAEGEADAETLDFVRFSRTLERRRRVLCKDLACDDVHFEVYADGGVTRLRATPIRNESTKETEVDCPSDLESESPPARIPQNPAA